MPKVTQYGPSRVQTQVTRGARAQSFELASKQGADLLAQGISNFSTQLGALQQKADQTEAENALVEFEREKNNLFFDPNSGYFNTQGRTAYDGANDVSERLRKLGETYSSRLSSENARNLFTRAASSQISRGNADVMRHASNQLDAWETATMQARVENSIETAQLYWNDEKRLKVQNAVGRQAVIDTAQKQGITGEALNERLQTYDASFAEGVIVSALNSSSKDGEKAMKQYGDMLEGDMKPRLKSKIAAKKEAENTKFIANQAVITGGNLVMKYSEFPDARSKILDEVNKIKNPELRKQTSKEAMSQLDLRLRAESEERANTYEQAETFMGNGGSVQQYKSQFADDWLKLSPKQRNILESGKAVSTDFDSFSQLMLLPKEELAEINPADYVSILAPTERAKLLSAVKSARSGGVDHQVGRTRAAETKAAIDQLFGGRPDGGYKKEKLEQVNIFYSLINDETQAREKQKGAPLTSVEYTDMLNEMTKKVVTEKFFGLWTSEENLSDIPAEDLGVISDYLQQNNIPATAENILKAYEQAR